MGTDKVTFVEQQGGVTGSDRVRMRNWYILYYYHSSSTVVPLHMTDRATGSNVTPKGFPRVRACTTEVGVSRPFWGILTGNDVIRSTGKKYEKMYCFITSYTRKSRNEVFKRKKQVFESSRCV